MVGSQEVVGYRWALHFQGEMAHKEAPLHSNCHKTYIAKSIAYIINQSCGEGGGCLYKPTSGIQWTPEHSWTSDRP